MERVSNKKNKINKETNKRLQKYNLPKPVVGTVGAPCSLAPMTIPRPVVSTVGELLSELFTRMSVPLATTTTGGLLKVC